MQRRRFLGAVLATFTAPAIVRASSLMPVRAYGGITGAIPAHFGDGALYDVGAVKFMDLEPLGIKIDGELVRVKLVAGETYVFERQIEYRGQRAYVSQTLRLED